MHERECTGEMGIEGETGRVAREGASPRVVGTEVLLVARCRLCCSWMRNEDAVHVSTAVRGTQPMMETGKRWKAVRLALGGEDAFDRDQVFRVGRRVLAEVENLLGRLGEEGLALGTEGAVEAFCAARGGFSACQGAMSNEKKPLWMT